MRCNSKDYQSSGRSNMIRKLNPYPDLLFESKLHDLPNGSSLSLAWWSSTGVERNCSLLSKSKSGYRFNFLIINEMSSTTKNQIIIEREQPHDSLLITLYIPEVDQIASTAYTWWSWVGLIREFRFLIDIINFSSITISPEKISRYRRNLTIFWSPNSECEMSETNCLITAAWSKPFSRLCFQPEGEVSVKFKGGRYVMETISEAHWIIPRWWQMPCSSQARFANRVQFLWMKIAPSYKVIISTPEGL